MQIKYSSKLRSRHALGFIRASFWYRSFIGKTRSFTSSHTKTFRTRFPHFFRNVSASSTIARFSSIDRYWSTPVIPVVLGAISEVIRSKCESQSVEKNDVIRAVSKISACKREIFWFQNGSIRFWSIPTTLPSGHTFSEITCRKLPGADARSSTCIFGCRRWNFSSISISLKALRARYPSAFAFLKKGSFTINWPVIEIILELTRKNDLDILVQYEKSSFIWHISPHGPGDDVTESLSTWRRRVRRYCHGWKI